MRRVMITSYPSPQRRNVYLHAISYAAQEIANCGERGMGRQFPAYRNGIKRRLTSQSSIRDAQIHHDHKRSQRNTEKQQTDHDERATTAMPVHSVIDREGMKDAKHAKR